MANNIQKRIFRFDLNKDEFIFSPSSKIIEGINSNNYNISSINKQMNIIDNDRYSVEEKPTKNTEVREVI